MVFLTTKRWLLIFGAVALLCAGLLLWRRLMPKGPVVTVSQDGVVIYTIDLSKVHEPYQLTVEGPEGYNILEVTPETVLVREADCGNQICVHHGPLTQNGTPITCLPHRLVIRWDTP